MSATATDAGALGRGYARAIVALRFLIVPAWIAAAVAAYLYLPGLRPASGGFGGLVSGSAPALSAEQRMARLFRVPLVTDTMVVERNPRGLSRDEQERVIRRALRVNDQKYRILDVTRGAVPILNAGGVFPSSRERSTTAITYLFFSPDVSITSRSEQAQKFASLARVPPGTVIGSTGAAPARLAQFGAIQDALFWVGLATVLLIAVLIGLNFRAPLAPLVVLFAAGIAYVVDLRLLGWISEHYAAIPKDVEPVMTVLLLGIVTDYAIFYLSGHRRRISEGDDPVEAARKTTAAVTPIVLAAGLTVAGATAAVLVGRLPFLRAFGPGLALTAIVGMIVAATLVPALLGLFRTWVYWPSLARGEVLADEGARQRRRSIRSRLAYWATARPLAFLIAAACFAGLAAAATGMFHTRLGFSLTGDLPPGSVDRATKQATAGFAPGILSPTVLLLERPGIAARRAPLAELQRELERQPGVAGVLGPTGHRLDRRFRVFVSRRGNAARYAVVFDHDPFDGVAIERLNELEARLPELLTRAGLGGTQATFTGGTALADQTIDDVLSDLTRIAPVVLAASFVLLALLLRALVAPLYLLGASVLALAAALGLTTYVFQDAFGGADLTYYVPFAASILLVSLGSDYNIFVAGRIWDEARHRPFREAVAEAAPRAARAITVAGLVLAFSFALLAIVQLRSFRELAFAMFVGVLLDAFVVRSLFVPALVSLFGSAGSWPSDRLRARRERRGPRGRPPVFEDETVGTRSIGRR